MGGELHGKVALVTGASTGIGRATALGLAQAGADVVVHYASKEEDARLVAKLVQDLGRKAFVVQGDFRDRDAPARVAEAAMEHWGHVDILVNNAALIEQAMSTVEGGDFGRHLERWDDVVNANLRAPYELTFRLAQRMRERRQGVVVNVASVSGMYALTDAPLYSLTKAALLHFTRQAAQMYAPHVRVNAVAPGWVQTGFGGGFILDAEFQKQASRHVPMRRFGVPDEVADAILFLCKGASYVTGTTLVVDGGMVSELR